MRLWQASWLKLFGVDAPPVAEPDKAIALQGRGLVEELLFDLIKQSYLISGAPYP